MINHPKRRIATIALLIAIINSAFAQVSVTVRNPQAYDSPTFAYEGARVMFVDEAATPAENNVFLWSKAAPNAQPDELHFKRFRKTAGQWQSFATATIRHHGPISIQKSRKAFLDADKDQSVDAFFVYGKHDDSKEQISVHLLISHLDQTHTISAFKADSYAKNSFSVNYEKLPSTLKAAALKFWTELDKN